MFSLDDGGVSSDNEDSAASNGRVKESTNAAKYTTLGDADFLRLWSSASSQSKPTITKKSQNVQSQPTPLFILDTDPTSTVKVNVGDVNVDSDKRPLELSRKESKFPGAGAFREQEEQSDVLLLNQQKASVYVDLEEKLPTNSSDLEDRRRNLRRKVDSKKVDEIMKKSVITEEFLKQEKVLPYYESLNAQKKRRRGERERTKGGDWFNMPAMEMTDERKRDLEILLMRNSLDTKNYYRHEDRKVLPKFFQVGTVVEHATDFYTDRVPKKQRKQTIADELLADADFRRKNKERYKAVVQSKSRFTVRKRWPKKSTTEKVNL